MQSGDGEGEPRVAEVFRPGYTLKGRVIRPAGRARGAGLRRWPPRRRSGASGSRRTTTRSSACPRTPTPRRSRRPTASSRSSTTRTRTPGTREAEERFKEISAAYDVLGDAEKRAAYDRAREMGAAGFGGGFPGGGRPGGPGPAASAERRRSTSRTCSAACSVARRRRARRHPVAPGRRPRDRRLALVRRRDGGRDDAGHAHRPRACSVCKGSGAAPGTQPVTCPDCGGVGQRAVNQGFFQTHPDLSALRRQRSADRDAVSRPAAARAPSAGSAPIQVKIPPGVRDGARIKVAGKGEPGRPRAGRPGTCTSGCRSARTPSSGARATT